MSDSQLALPAASLLARTIRGAGWVVAWRWGTRLLGLVSTLILVRLLQPADFGLVTLATGFMQTIDGMMALGIEEAIIREPAPSRAFYDTAFTLNLLRGLSVSLCLAVLAIPAARFFADPRLGPVLLFIAALPLLDECTNIGVVEFRRNFAFHKDFAIMVLPKLCGIIAAITAAFLLRSYVAMLCGIGVTRVLRVVMSYVMHPYRPALCLRAWRGLTACSLWTWLLSLAVLLRDRADSLLIGRMLQVSAVGYFSVGAEIAALPSTELIEPMGRAAFSGFAAGRQEKADPGEAFLRLIGFAALLGLPAGVGLALVAAPVVRIAFGPGWTQAVPVLRILSLSSTIMVLGHLSLHLLSAYALLGRLVGMTLIGAAARLGLLLVLIPRWGLPGAAIAAGAAMLVEQGLTVATALCRFRVTVAALARETWRPVLSVFAMAAILTVMGLGWTDDTSPATLIAASLVGGAVYCGVLSCTWLSVGKPAGAEQDILRLLWRRIR